MKYKKISVLVVTYNQSDVIARNIESILQQKEYGLHEIVICDDCSSDNNWEIIQNYVNEYPNIIRAYRNTSNLGIYGNSDKCANLHGDADLFCWLEGDDALELGFFKSIQEFIYTKNIDVGYPLGIYCDYSSINPDGKKILYPNSKIMKECHPLSLYVRGLVSWRASVFSKTVIERFVPTILDKGLGLAEFLFDSQWFRNIENAYYNPIKGSIYYEQIGVSTELGYQSSFKKEQALIKWRYALDNGYAMNIRDRSWFQFKIIQTLCLITPSLMLIIKSLPLYFYSMSGYGALSYSTFKSNFAPILRALLKK